MAPTASAELASQLPVDLDLDDEQQQLLEATRGYLGRHYPLEDVRPVLESDRRPDPDGWREAAGMGWIAAHVPEDRGGLGGGPAEASIIASEMGRAVNWTPFLGCSLAAASLAAGATPGSRAAGRLQELMDGETTIAWCGPEPRGFAWDASTVRSTAEESDGGFVLNGEKRLVPDADLAEHLVVAARVDGTLAEFLVPADSQGLEIVPSRTLDLTRRFTTVVLRDVVVEAADRVGEPGTSGDGFDRTLALASVLVNADAIGAAEKLMEMTVEYSKGRIAFQRPIGSYQAVKHMCADMLLGVEASNAANRYAALAIGEDSPGRERAVAVAGSYVSDATARIAGDSLQIHGGIGFTWEHDLHLFLRRIKVDQALFGDAPWHRERLASEIF